MGALQASKNWDLLAGESKNVQAKGKYKGKDNINSKFEPMKKLNPSYVALSSKKDK